MKSIIIDNEATTRAIILHLCKSHKAIDVLAEFSNGIDAIKYLNRNEVDLVFIDIHLPEFTGFELIQTLKKPPKVVVISSDANYAIHAFEYCCIVDYLLKPITPKRFYKAIEKAISVTTTPGTGKLKNMVGPNTNELYINIDKRLIKVDLHTINLIEANGDYIDLKTDNQRYTVLSTLKNIQRKLPSHMFLQVHRSYIINVNKIVDIEDHSVLINKDIIPVSRPNRQKLMQRINLL